ncbi:dienelactone hydrolase [Trichoderma cornu-damae]|uniref:Dienelactone hydrolase n=1 Tax=Trichoderma cornu-damae TaxID=654480 RepID=A0A9P8QWF6_9HYPO|nr:dienelactone hydrolase [Trichoderma cornu-damae]
MASHPPGKCCVVGTLHKGETTGKDIKIDGTIDAYLATPPADKARQGRGILFISDAIGIYQNSKLLADNFAAQGYTVLLPDIFNGDALKLNQLGNIDLSSWIAKGTTGDNPHTPPAVDSIIVKSLKALKDLGVERVGSVGYCFGAKYVVRHYKHGIHVGYVAHPTMVDEDELAAITGPLSIAAAQTDTIFPTEKRHKSEEILIQTGQPFQINLYSGVSHGFAVRSDPSVKIAKFSKEQAFFQALAWFEEYL